ncbi:hypothetical protein BamMC406_6721 (plasmid) [Burkholderia ambifaria MC40-6]|uniref:Uncharacterized protein n=1 Tax=Burkholderia ambifaria (strain MC40-6) TaxID=398577 RepID=B1Z6P6_BURA4|nr:hypothetical protein BamMC406_6721 [Burkholderia ambifaria MC40-6]
MSQWRLNNARASQRKKEPLWLVIAVCINKMLRTWGRASIPLTFVTAARRSYRASA